MAKVLMNFRLDAHKAEQVRAKASVEGKTMAEVLNALLDDWLNKDVNMQNQLLSIASKQVSETVRCRNEITIVSGKIENLMYSLFCAFPERFEKEFMKPEKLTNTDTYVKGQEMHRKADHLIRLWDRKRVQARRIAHAEMAGVLDEMNKEQSK